MAAYIYIDPASGATTSKWTYSVWFKRSKLSSAQTLLGSTSTVGGGITYTQIVINADDTISFYNSDGGSADGYLRTSAKYRDVGAWMHIVCVWDSANGTTTDKMKMYINGVEPIFGTDDAPSGNTTIGNTYIHAIGAFDDNGDGTPNTEFFLGDMSHSQMYNNAAYAATDFGSFDSTSGIWKINTSGPSATYGTNGWFLKMEDRTNLDLDSSNNAYTFSTSGTLTPTYDNPSNNFCTANLVQHSGDNYVFSDGNTTVADNAGGVWRSNTCTLGAAKGKFYFEARVKTTGNYRGIGVMNPSYSSAHNENFADTAGGWSYAGNGNKRTNDAGTSYGNTYTGTDHIGCAYDITNGVIWFSKNGVWQNSATIAEINAGTTTNAAWSDIPTGNLMVPAIATNNNTAWEWNFGNGYFGDVAITSAGTNASGNGDFEYDVPTGYTAWCTKGINSF